MTSFQDRERAEEAKFAHDADTLFRIQARRNRLVGEWAAERMDLSQAETDAYAKAVVQADFEEAGDEDVIRKLLGDLTAAGVDTTEAEVRAALAAKQVEARRAFLG
ncbi:MULTISPECIES: DUF1476 domain-containing protein [Novosphingobium]|jgi:hypothetical protein|uniref:Aldolase n=3 Tax=Sphingomonadaceae TaxID=41297 RepID=A0A031JKR9_9SPHN|nr:MULTISPECIES: DUF1476 domain-containing protein [Novosphingobium]AOR78357.1 aldolase [Novosphingobium resinovorum]EZP73847.1 hypothetical protein BV97_04839 [Novosphingobium resinovorum]MBF7010527.1 DUF1476 domain-containing protein [Novosphingobium sp. HR1a]WJM28527.1 DUF1476 domain-containing protein [Novosphingobium resinovorum]GLK43510.1 hypothetical protein GCM10017612_14290 [Novosphingobium resinovorum]